MIRRIFNILIVAGGIYITALVIFAVPSFSDPEFEVHNDTSSIVSLVVYWRNHEKHIGDIAPMSRDHFSIDDEAAITFKVRYATGRTIESQPLYFSSGLKIIANITDNEVNVRYGYGK